MRRALLILGILSDGDIDWLTAVGNRQTCAPGSFLVREGEPLEAFFVLLEGRLSVRTKARPDEELNSLLPGEIVGELSFLDSRPPSASVVADGESTVLSVPRNKLSAKLDSDPMFAARFYRSLSVFLAHRLRRQTFARDGDLGVSMSLSEDEEVSDEIDPALLDSISLGAKRFEYLLSRTSGA